MIRSERNDDIAFLRLEIQKWQKAGSVAASAFERSQSESQAEILRLLEDAGIARTIHRIELQRQKTAASHEKHIGKIRNELARYAYHLRFLEERQAACTPAPISIAERRAKRRSGKSL